VVQQVEVIVIGSGFGGAICASRLAEAGVAVKLVERGPWRDTVPVRSMGIASRVPFPRGRMALMRLMRTLRNDKLPFGGVTLNKKGLFELHISKGLNIVSSSNVGGGSHVYAGLNVPPPEPGYWDGITDELSETDMAKSYDRVLERMGSRAPMADDQLPTTMEERFADSDVIDAQGADHEVPMGFLFPETPGQPRKVTTEDGVERYEMTPGEEGNLGSEKGGKTSLDFAYLARALKHGLQVLDQCEVSAVRQCTDGQGRYAVDLINHHTGKRETHRADNVILAAGTMNTLRLLFHSREAGYLAEMPRLGQHFGGNGDYFGYWHLDDKDRDLTKGMPARGMLRMKGDDLLGADRAWPIIGEGALPNPKALPLGGWVSRKLRRGTYVAGMGADAQDGTVSYRKGKLTIDYDPDNSDIFSRIKDAFKLIGEKTGRRIYHFDRPITVHPTGGACIGQDVNAGVVDSNGEVFNNPGLYVADAAALPKPIGGPPAISIGAWADHLAERFIERRAAGDD